MLLDTGSHLLDFLLFSTGLTVDRVTAYSSNLGSPVDINSAVSVQFSGDCLGNISIIGHAPKPVVEAINIFGDEGSILIESRWGPGQFGARVSQESYSDGKIEVLDLPDGSNPDANFVDAILGRDDVKSPGEAGLEVIRFTEAIQESIRLGREVMVA